MIEIYNRINEIFSRMSLINSRFNKIPDNSSRFKAKLSDIQEKIYNENLLSKKDLQYSRIIKNTSEKYAIPQKLIKSIIKQESGFNPKAVSPKGAKGLMQLMPQTANLLGVKNIFNPEENIEAGVKYLRMMLNRFQGDIKLALAAYNAGPEAVEKNKGVPDYQETKDYISNVLKNLEIF